MTLFLSAQPLFLATHFFEIHIEAGNSGVAYDKAS